MRDGQEFDHGLAWPFGERLRPVDVRASSASSGRIAATAPASHGLGSRPVIRIVCSVSSCSAAACSARVEIQPNRIAATIQPHSMSLRRPIGVPGGMGPSISTTSRAPAMAAAVARRCHASSRAAGETCAMARRLHDAHAGSWPAMAVAGSAAAVGAARVAPPPPLKGGGCSTGCQSFLSGVITAAMTFLSG